MSQHISIWLPLGSIGAAIGWLMIVLSPLAGSKDEHADRHRD